MELAFWLEKVSLKLNLSPESKSDLLRSVIEKCIKRTTKSNYKENYSKKTIMSDSADKLSSTLILKPNEFGNICFLDTKLIFKSIHEKYIVAHEGLHGEWQPLTRQDIRECKRNRLRYKVLDLTFHGEVR
jgi:hypothetical protein